MPNNMSGENIESAEPLPADARPSYFVQIDGEPVDVYRESGLPEHPVCQEHLRAGADKRLQAMLWEVGGAELPEVGAAPMVRYGYACAGELLGICGLRLIQYDRNGTPVKEIKLEG